MWKARVFDFALFFTSVIIAISYWKLDIQSDVFLIALVIFIFFSMLYYRFRIIDKKLNNLSIDYGISYSLSFVIIAGPLGLFIFELIYRFMVYAYKKKTKTADPGEFLDTFYNIGSFVVSNSVAYYLYIVLYPSFEPIPFGFWLLMILLVYVNTFLSGSFLATVLYILKDIKTLKEALHFMVGRVNIEDIGKILFTNGLLILFIQEEKWEMAIALFILNYVVSKSYYSKSQSIKNKLERDQFEQMAYTDFLTGVYNRTFMDKKIAELNTSGENIGVVVADIDNFKKVNDQYNHAVGDRVIQHFTKTLKSFLNKNDYLFRSGGEEFTIFLRERDYESTRQLVESIRKTVEETPAMVDYNNENITISYTASFGLYFFKPTSELSLEKAYIHADELLFDSKEKLKNIVSAECGKL